MARTTPKRVTLLNGTPTGNSPLGYYGQVSVLGLDCLGFKNFYQFRHQYAELANTRFSGRMSKQVVGFKNLEDLTERMKPWCVRREKSLLNLPPKLPLSFVSVNLDAKTWKVYKDVAKHMLAEWDGGRIAIQYAPVKILRLAQVASGFITGSELAQESISTDGGMFTNQLGGLTWFSYEKIGAFLNWWREQLTADRKAKVVVWCRFRPQLELLIERLKSLQLALKFDLGWQYGGNEHNPNGLHPNNSDFAASAFVLVAQPQAGRFGRNYARAHTNVWLSADYDSVTFEQATDRPHRHGLDAPLQNLAILAEGPDGQRTVDHDIYEVLKEKRSVAHRLESEWRRVLEVE